MLNPDLSDEPPLRLPSHTSNASPDLSPSRSPNHSPSRSHTLPHQTTGSAAVVSPRWPRSGSVTDENSYSVTSSDEREPVVPAAAAWWLLRQDSVDENMVPRDRDDDDDRHWDDNVTSSSEHFDHHVSTAAADDDDGGAVQVDSFYDACETLSAARDIADTSTAQSSTASEEKAGNTPLCNGRLASDHHRPALSTSSSSSSSLWSSRSGLVLIVILSSVLLAVLLLLSGLVVLAYVVLESDVDLPVVASIRRLPEVCQFHRDHYSAWRAWIIGAHSHAAGTTWQHCIWMSQHRRQRQQTSLQQWPSKEFATQRA